MKEKIELKKIGNGCLSQKIECINISEKNKHAKVKHSEEKTDKQMILFLFRKF